MRRRAAWMAALGTLVACGGEGTRNPNEVASGGGAAGTQSQLAGSGGELVSKGGSNNPAGGSAGAGGGQGGGPVGGASAAGAAGAAGSAGESGTITTPEMLMPAVTAFCAAARACCAEQSEPALLDDCESSWGSKNQVVASLMRGWVTLDEADLATCLAAYEAAAASCEQLDVIEACAGIAQGTRAEGQTCSSGSECAGSPGPNACLITEPNGSLGVCKQVTHGGLGDECAFTCRPNEGCDFTRSGTGDSPTTVCFEAEGFYCSYDAVPATCQALKATSTGCEDDDECGSQGYCDFGGTGACQMRGQLDQDCGLCVPSLSCVDGKCKSPPFSSGSTCEGFSYGPY